VARLTGHLERQREGQKRQVLTSRSLGWVRMALLPELRNQGEHPLRVQDTGDLGQKPLAVGRGIDVTGMDLGE